MGGGRLTSGFKRPSLVFIEAKEKEEDGKRKTRQKRKRRISADEPTRQLVEGK